MQNQHPILYEGLHSCYTISDPRLADRIKICRTSNIEHDYYYHIAKACRNPIHKAFHLIEAIKFKNFQKNLRHAALILPISTTDAHYLKNIFPAHLVKFIPAFHPDNAINAKAGAGNYLLYHAKLSVHENEQIARYLITKIIPNIAVTCIIAGMNPSAKLKKDIARLPNARLIPNPDDDSMNQLIANAHIHILPTFQPTGLKLKLLKSLFNGRHIIVNSKMLAGTGLDHLCHIADNQEDIIQTINRLMLIPFSDKEIQLRRQTLLPFFTSHHQAQQLIRLISNCEPQQRATATPST
jgi:hypothetical protein